jgi:hypothetical protein
VGKRKRVDVYLEVRKRRGHIFFELNETSACDQDYPCQHIDRSISDLEKHGKVRQHWGQKRKKTCVCIKRIKTDSYLTYGQ